MPAGCQYYGLKAIWGGYKQVPPAIAARNPKIKDRELLKEGYYADIVIFDPKMIEDHATYAEPHQLATGVRHVFVNPANQSRQSLDRHGLRPRDDNHAVIARNECNE